jgi:hypothetical protein
MDDEVGVGGVIVLVLQESGFHGSEFCVKRRLFVPRSLRALRNHCPFAHIVFCYQPSQASGFAEGSVSPCVACGSWVFWDYTASLFKQRTSS